MTATVYLFGVGFALLLALAFVPEVEDVAPGPHRPTPLARTRAPASCPQAPTGAADCKRGKWSGGRATGGVYATRP